MYNEDRKNDFINSDINRNDLTDSLFRSISEIEELFEKDVCDFSKEEILFLLQTTESKRFYTIEKYKNIITIYIDWCIQKGYCKVNEARRINSTEIENILTEKGIKDQLITREDFLLHLKELRTARMKYVMLMLFEVGGKNNFRDLLDAKEEDINGHELKLIDRTVTISDELLKVIHQAKEEDSVPWGHSTRDLIDNGRILKDFYQKDSSTDPIIRYKKIYAQVVKALKEMEYNCSVTDIVTAGIVHYINCLAKQNNIQPYTVIATQELYDKVKNQYNISRFRWDFLRQYRSYLI